MPERRVCSRLCALAVLTMAGGMLNACAATEALKAKIAGTETHYAITGAPEKATGDYLDKILTERVKEKTESLSDDPETRARQERGLEQLVRADLLKALQSKGYYNARVRYRDGKTPFSGRYEVRSGRKFTIDTLAVTPDSFRRYLNDRDVRRGYALDAAPVLATQAALDSRIQKDGCYFTLDVKNAVTLDRRNATGALDYAVDAGPQARFGPVSFKGGDGVKRSYLRRLVPWKEGDCFRREKIEEYKASLLKSAIFARADAVLPDAPAADGSVPITMDLRERAQRTVSAGLTYYSDEGPGGVLGWEHRNLFGAAEKLSLALKLSQLKQSLDAEFTKPYFLRKDQSLSLTSEISNEDTDAYKQFGAEAGASISRAFTKHLTGDTGVKLSVLEIEDNIDQETSAYGLVSLPQGLTWDRRDDKLDPHRGWNLSARGAPFFDVLGEASPFFKLEGSASSFIPLGTPLDLVFASKAGVGSIWGAEIENVPATERFYAGGGGSVRGFGYQDVGPQEDGDPTGGRSIVNFSLELRSKFTDTLGAVAFVDGASVSEETSPRLSEPAIGAGVGLRYFTSFGPLRFDIATPITQKEDTDRSYQFYISIGQAF